MNKLLLDQVQRALQAQEDTIQRQQQMLDDKDQNIAELKDSLTRLSLAQTRETKRLPILIEQLQNKIDEQISVQSNWMSHHKNFSESMEVLVTESMTLCNAQIQLVESMKEYQSAIMPQKSLNDSTGQLESKLNDLQELLNGLKNSQTKMTNSQKVIQAELTELDKLLPKLEK